MKGQKKIIIILVIFLVFTSILAVYLSLNMKEPTENDTPNEINKNVVINKEIELLDDDSIFFGIQKVINDFYLDIASKNNANVYKKLDPSFALSNNLNSNNAASLLNKNYEAVSFYAMKIYYNIASTITYYFINGFLTNTPVMDGAISYDKDVNYLVIVSNNNNYIIRPLDSNIDMENYAKSYNIQEVKVNNGFVYKNEVVREKNKIDTYINMFMILLYVDNERAYNMLDNETQKYYLDASNFLEYRDNIYTSIFFDYTAKKVEEKEDETIYSIQNDNLDTITITEYAPMDFKIGYIFN